LAILHLRVSNLWKHECVEGKLTFRKNCTPKTLSKFTFNEKVSTPRSLDHKVVPLFFNDKHLLLELKIVLMPLVNFNDAIVFDTNSLRRASSKVSESFI